MSSHSDPTASSPLRDSPPESFAEFISSIELRTKPIGSRLAEEHLNNTVKRRIQSTGSKFPINGSTYLAVYLARHNDVVRA